MITIKNNQRKINVDIKKIKADTQEILDILDYADYDLGILLTNQKKIHFFNKTYRDKDKPTDILSFPYHPDLKAGERIQPLSPDDKNLGDIILCPEYIKNDLERWGKTFEERMQILLVHGICHLLGYDHIKDEDYAVMKKLEDFLLAKLSP